MSVPAATSSRLAQITSVPEGQWITPKQQLDRLHTPLVVRAGLLANAVVKKRNEEKGLGRIVGAYERLIPGLAKIVAEYGGDDSDPKLTNWHTGLSRIHAVPARMPPLSRNIHQMLDSPCPIHKGKKVGETHFFMLIPQELGTLNQLTNTLRAHGQDSFRYFWDTALQEHGDTPFGPTHWVLVTKDPIPGSRNKPYTEQVAKVAALTKNPFGEKALVNYEVPSLQDFSAAVLLYKVATGESLYQTGNEQNRNVYTYTRLQETTGGYHLVVGGFAPGGLVVCSDCGSHSYENIGVAGLRKF
jgi:hypothetical protein